jgi:membrane fusion protein, heavy metal efflux system
LENFRMKLNFLNQLLLRAAAGALFGFSGCQPHHPHDPAHGHDHAHEEKTAQITVWTDRYEVFVEHGAPVVNRPMPFITHITDLRTFEPRKQGAVTFVLRQREVTFKQVHAQPDRAGIYVVPITLPATGNWEVMLLIPANGNETLIELGLIRGYADAHAAAHARFPEAPEGVSFLKEQQWGVLSKTEPVKIRDMTERLPAPAQIRAKPGFSAAIAAPLAGELAAPSGKTLPQPGTTVEAGEVLALLHPRFSESAARFVEVEAEFGQAEAVLKQAEAAFNRTQRLVAQEARSERELQEAEAALASAKARFAAAASLRSTYAPNPSSEPNTSAATVALELRAPIAGIITSVSAGFGEPVRTDQIVFTILNPATVWIEARVPESAMARVGNARDALCQWSGKEEHFIAIGAEGGRLVFAGLEVDATTRTVPLIYELPNDKARLRIGQAVRVHIQTAQAQEVLAVPESAIVEESGQPIAFVQLSGETFEKRPLTLGLREGNFVQVVEGLKPGERVVTKGAYAILLSSISGVIPAHGHAH